jgi:hypothetical protein
VPEDPTERDGANALTRRHLLATVGAGAFGAFLSEAAKEPRPASRTPEPTKVRGLFAFDPDIDADKFAADCQAWGIRQPILHPGFFRDAKMARALANANLGLWLNLPVFYNPEHLSQHPEDYAVTNLGRRAVQDWCHFVCPSRERYLDDFVSGLRRTLSRLHPEIVSLDFIRHFVFWERVDLNGDPRSIEDGCYCPSCLAAFAEFSGEKVNHANPAAYIRAHLRRTWGDWKCSQIATIAARLFGEIRSVTKNARYAIKTLPWRESDLDGAIRSSAGQDVPALARHVDMVTPMAFTQILGQTPAWKQGLLRHVRDVAGKPVLSYLQTDKVIRPEEITIAQFEAELEESLGEEWAGLLVFDYEQLAANSTKASTLRKHLRE